MLNPLILALGQLGISLSEEWEEIIGNNISIEHLTNGQQSALNDFCSLRIANNTCISIPFASGDAAVEAAELICRRAHESGNIKSVNGKWVEVHPTP